LSVKVDSGLEETDRRIRWHGLVEIMAHRGTVR
jgi:hypothetical protein